MPSAVRPLNNLFEAFAGFFGQFIYGDWYIALIGLHYEFNSNPFHHYECFFLIYWIFPSNGYYVHFFLIPSPMGVKRFYVFSVRM